MPDFIDRFAYELYHLEHYEKLAQRAADLIKEALDREGVQANVRYRAKARYFAPSLSLMSYVWRGLVGAEKLETRIRTDMPALSSSDLLGLDPKSPRIGSNAKLYPLRQVISQTRKKLSLK